MRSESSTPTGAIGAMLSLDREAVMGHPSILILILPFEEWDRDVELDNIIEPDPRPNKDPLAVESRDGSSRGEQGAEPRTGRRWGVRWTRGEKIDKLISCSWVSVTVFVGVASVVGGVVG